MEDEYTGIDAQHDEDFFAEGLSLQEIEEIKQHKQQYLSQEQSE